MFEQKRGTKGVFIRVYRYFRLFVRCRSRFARCEAFVSRMFFLLIKIDKGIKIRVLIFKFNGIPDVISRFLMNFYFDFNVEIKF